MDTRHMSVSAEQRLMGWAQIVKECRSSELTCKEWCAQRGISERKYHYWQKRVFDRAILERETMVAGEREDVRFAELPPPQEAALAEADGGSKVVASIRIGGAVIEVYARTDAGIVRMLCQALKQC